MTERADIEVLVRQAWHDEDPQKVGDRVLELMPPAAAKPWLKGCAAHLGAARPIIVLQLEGSQPVLTALRAFESGAFA